MLTIKGRSPVRGGAAGGVCFLVLALGVLLTHRGVEGQDGLTYQRGQTVSPSYEGWQRNPDGSFNLLFGYMNRNWEERLEIPVGLDNSFSPGPADRGQPSYFLPRYTRMVFKVQVPPDFGDQELVWTLRTQGETKRAYGSLHRDYYLDDQTYQAQRGVYGGGGFREGAAENQPPIAELEGDRVRNVRVGEPLTLVAHVSDDGSLARDNSTLPVTEDGGLDLEKALATKPTSHTMRTHFALIHSWFVYRGNGDAVIFDPDQVKTWWDTRPFQSRWSLFWVPPEEPEDGTWVTRVTFHEPGTYVLRGRTDDGGYFVDQDVTVNVTR